MQRDQSAEASLRVVVIDEVKRRLHSAAGFGTNLFLHQGQVCFVGIAQRASQYGCAIEDVPSMEAENSIPVYLEKAASCLGDEHSATIFGEEENPVLKIAENLVKVLFQGREDLFDV